MHIDLFLLSYYSMFFIKKKLHLLSYFQPVLRKIKPSDSRNSLQQRPMQLGLEIKAGSPIILLPLSAFSDSVIVADLGEFSLKNSFHYADEPGIISIRRDQLGPVECLDVMHVDLVNTDLFAGVRHSKQVDDDDDDATAADRSGQMDMGSYYIRTKGTRLLNTKCHLKLLVERNLDSACTQNVPDVSVQGTLSRLEAVLDLQQYQLVRGFLSFNLGECIDDIFNESASASAYCGESYQNLSLVDDEIVSDFLLLQLTFKFLPQFFVFHRKTKTNMFGRIHR